jgi:hypothetical protein
MLKSLSHLIFLSLFFLFLAVLQFFWINSLPGFWQHFNMGVIVLTFSLFLFGLRPTLYYILIFGFFLDLFSFQFFSFNILLLLATLMVAYFFLNSLFTNKSLYSFWAIIGVNIFVYNILSAIILFFASGLQDKFLMFYASFWESVIYQLLWGLLSSVLLFNFFVSLIKKFKPFFLEKTGKM